MTEKQIKAAQRQLNLLEKIRKQLESCKTIGCITLEQVNEAALESNARCINIIKERLRLEENWARPELLY